MRWLIGIDCGGSRCRAVLSDSSGQILAHGHGGSANVITDANAAKRHLLVATKQAFACAGLFFEKEVSHAAAAIGIAGLNLRPDLTQWQASLPFGHCYLATDAHIALLGAFGDGDGTIAIIGTGSAFMSRWQGQIRTVGGWGFELGDDGSGAWLGHALLRYCLLAVDGIRPHSALTKAIQQLFQGQPTALAQYAHQAQPRHYGRLMPLLLRHARRGDAVANALLVQATRAIEDSLQAVMPTDDKMPLCLLGGLAKVYQARLGPSFQKRLQQPLGNTLDGALLLAQQRSDEKQAEHG